MLGWNSPPDVVGGQGQRDRAEPSREHSRHGGILTADAVVAPLASAFVVITLVVLVLALVLALALVVLLVLVAAVSLAPAVLVALLLLRFLRLLRLRVLCPGCRQRSETPLGGRARARDRLRGRLGAAAADDEPRSRPGPCGSSARKPVERRRAAGPAPSSEPQPVRPARPWWTARREPRGAESEVPPGTRRRRAASGRRRTQSPGPHQL